VSDGIDNGCITFGVYHVFYSGGMGCGSVLCVALVSV
jgi:hypothetical protein